MDEESCKLIREKEDCYGGTKEKQYEDDENAQDIDEVLDQKGPLGCLQLLIQLSTFYLFLVTVYNFVFTFFTGNDPGWRCVSRNSSSSFCQKHYGKVIRTDSDLFQRRCQLNRSEWTYTTPQDFSFVTEFDLICDKTSLAALMGSSYYIGGVLGSVVTGPFSDRYGRVYILLFCSLFSTISSIGSSYISNIWQLFTLNVIQGAGSVACFYTTIVYQSEFSSPKYRPLATSVLLFGATCSFLLVDLLANFIRKWRQLSVYAALPGIPALLLLFFAPESPRWLLTSGKKDEAERVMESLVSLGDKDVKIHLKLPKTSVEPSVKYSYLDLVRHSQVLKLSTVVVLMWFVLPVVYYSIALQSASLGGNMYVAFALSTIADLPSYCFSTYLSNKIGRKKTNLGGLFVSGLLMGSLAFVPKHLTYKFTVNLTISMLARFSVCIAFCGMYTWTFELFPTVVRSQALSLCAVADRLGMFAVPFIIKLLQRVVFYLPSLILCIMAIFASLIGLYLPETNEKPTMERYEDFFDASGKDSDLQGLIDSREEP